MKNKKLTRYLVNYKHFQQNIHYKKYHELMQPTNSSF